ncbi:hypothetical protein ALO80_100674 [Pseudomonas caricapapayae]|uniref:Uncharacterized protein n=1 Tax=Pseudomonas caricapapayae TaxID=46678 RepID=A0A0P9PRF3_9PSED|nr:hypothetical protein F4W67_07910 [Pseudomonas caricapapayae]KPW59940.1 hypothetical protein ALO80_100674 [Pseudomonas caricapapayae]RMM06452.1 hypothetical protein ALQ84_03191 [Pseudomonas caricapapayae]
MHLSGMCRFCHVVIAHRRCSRCRAEIRLNKPIMQFAIPQKAIIAKCTAHHFFKIYKHLIFKDFLSISGWHADCIISISEHISSQTVGHRYWKMNKTLSALNAAALVALVAFHFQDSGAKDTQVTAPAPVHHQISHAPQLAIMTDRVASAAMLANDDDESLQMPRAEQRWIF